MVCPKCGSQDVVNQIFQEQAHSKAVTRKRSKIREKRHGLLWWLFIGWWWWIFDLMLWIVFFPIRLLIAIFRKRNFSVSGKDTLKTKNNFKYTSVSVCQNCGHKWEN